jgi:hypothetical protein
MAFQTERIEKGCQTQPPQTESEPVMSNTFRYWQDWVWSHFAGKRQKDMFNGVTAYCMFIGHARSGHTICGALLNAHPEAVISHELHALQYVKRGISRDQLYALILRRDRHFAVVRKNIQGQFNYHVPNQWQGRFRRLKVIGDKRGGGSSSLLGESPELLSRLRGIAAVPLRMIHIVRNPFDNISTLVRRQGGTLETQMSAYFARTETNAQLIKTNGPAEIITMRHEDLIAQPKEHLRRLVEFVGLEADDPYLADCAGILYESPSKSRLKAQWSTELIATIQSKIKEYPFLHGYSFEN